MTRSEVAIIGAAGFTGRELLEILAHHPGVEVSHITSNQHAGEPVESAFGTLVRHYSLRFCRHDEPLPKGALLFLAVPNATSLELVPSLLAAGHRIIDLSGVYRLHSLERFESTYGLKHSSFELLSEAVYGMPELYRDRIAAARLVANPGCYPTAAILTLALLGDLRSRIAAASVNAASGVSGAGGRVEDAGFSFNSVHENFRAYKILRHQHEPEVEEYGRGKADFPLVFTPHLLPLFRGILATTTIFWRDSVDAEQIADCYRRAASREPFIRFRETPEEIELSSVQGSNFIDIAVRTRGRESVVVAAIDNLQKGAAGQAVQNLNLMLGHDETTAL